MEIQEIPLEYKKELWKAKRKMLSQMIEENKKKCKNMQTKK